jgi:hypothetical protein
VGQNERKIEKFFIKKQTNRQAKTHQSFPLETYSLQRCVSGTLET